MSTKYFKKTKIYILQIQLHELEKGNITIKEVQDFFNKHLINNISRLDVEYVSHKHWEANEVKLKENNSNIKREAISSIEEFKNKNEKYPDFYNLN